ncbi:hypothetical protein LSCM1_00227 [Leishmania martiniquensis]|uniref:Uncharacterized protein n=1 Tax=Leishmania martiniquensis TaxID=1580590 RepID=A0A836K9N4_9TRYP|nr:hypothetical protein LSCM1_00227 [Leishmania martiniquensis]
MDGKPRQYGPPAVGDLPAHTAATERLICLRRGARPLLSTLQAPVSQSAQSSREQTTAGIHLCAPSFQSERSQVSLPTVRACTHSHVTTTAASAATPVPRPHRGGPLHLPSPCSSVRSPLTSSTSSSSPAPAAVAAAAAAAALLRIRNKNASGLAAGSDTSGQPSRSESVPQSSSQHLAPAPPLKAVQSCLPPNHLPRPHLSAVTATSRTAGEPPTRSHTTISSVNLSPQCVFPSSQNTLASGAPLAAMDLYRKVLGPAEYEVGHSGVFGRAARTQAGLKRPREPDVSEISDDEDDSNDGGDGGHRDSIRSSSLSPSCSSSSMEKASALPRVRSDADEGLPRALGEGDDVIQGRAGRVDDWATRPTVACPGLLPRPVGIDESPAPRPQHTVGPGGLPPHWATAPSEEEVGQATFDGDTEEDEDTGADEETGEEDGGRGRRNVVQSDPLRVVVDFDQLKRVSAGMRSTVAAAPSSGGALQQTEEVEALLADDEERVGLQRNASQDGKKSCLMDTEREAHEIESARAFLQKRERADVQRRAAQAAHTPAPPSELLLDLLQHLPSAPGRVIYNRSSCPPATTTSGFSDDFHKEVQKFMTRIVLQRDGRTGYEAQPSACVSEAAVVHQDGVRSGRHGFTQQKCAKKKQKEAEAEQLVEAVERGIAADVRDVVAYSRFVMQEQLHQERRKAPKRCSPLSKTAVEASERGRCALTEMGTDGGVAASDQHQQLAELRAVVEKKLSIMRAAVEAADKEGDAESAALRTKGAEGGESDAKEAPVAREAAPQSAKARLVAAHARFMDIVRNAAAYRREKAEAAEAAEKGLEATVAAWRRSYDTLLTRELNRHWTGTRPEKQSRTEARQRQPEKHQRTQRHQPSADLWEMTKGLRKSERKRLHELFKAAASAFPAPSFEYRPPPSTFPE